MAIPKTVPDTVVLDGYLVYAPDYEELDHAVRDADHSPDQAFRCLELMSAFNAANQPMPSALHDRFFRAVEKAGRVRDPALRSNVFMRELGLSPKKRPARMSFMEVGQWLTNRPVGESRTQSIKLAAKHFKISTTTARTYWTLYEEAKQLGVQYSADGQWDD